jgi:serine protease
MNRLLVALSISVISVSGLASAGLARAQSSGGPDAHAPQDRPQILMRIRGGGPASGTNGNLYYHGGTTEAGVSGDVGVETGADKVYLIYWGSQWNNNDPSKEANVQQTFFNGVGGSSWNNSVTQYCEGISSGSLSCGGTPAANPTNVLGGVWYDNSSAAPHRPTQSQLASEATRAAAHFGNTTAASNTTVQYVINTATGNNASGFGSRYCAWHSSTTSSYGDIAYTNMPYITDAGASCGANFNGLGANAGITIVGGHEFAETETDIFPNSGWLDSSGSENGDKCAWITSGQGAAANITLGSSTFPVQSLWSNASSSCVLSCP